MSDPGEHDSVTWYLQTIWAEGALLLREEPFTLKSGLRSHVYVNHRALICDPDTLRFFAMALVERTLEAYGGAIAYCAIDSSTSPYLVAACSLASGTPFVNYRPVNREKGLRDVVFSPPSYREGERPRIVFVDDVVTTSGTLDNAAMDLEFAGWRVAGAVCLLDRRTSAGDDGIDIHAVGSLRQALEYGLANHLVAGQLRRHAEQELSAL